MGSRGEIAGCDPLFDILPRDIGDPFWEEEFNKPAEVTPCQEEVSGRAAESFEFVDIELGEFDEIGGLFDGSVVGEVEGDSLVDGGLHRSEFFATVEKGDAGFLDGAVRLCEPVAPGSEEGTVRLGEDVGVLALHFEGELCLPEPFFSFGAGIEVALDAFAVYGAEIRLPSEFS